MDAVEQSDVKFQGVALSADIEELLRDAPKADPVAAVLSLDS